MIPPERIWSPEDANKLLTGNKGSNKTRGIICEIIQAGGPLQKFDKLSSLYRIEINNCKELREIPRLPQSIRYVDTEKCPSLLPQSSSRLLNQFGKILGILPNGDILGFLGDLNVSLSAPNNSELLALLPGPNMDHEVSNTVNDLRLLKGIHDDGCDLSLSLNDSDERETFSHNRKFLAHEQMLKVPRESAIKGTNCSSSKSFFADF
nr:hypothetical protein CFP56_35428 [Quercus suber]